MYKSYSKGIIEVITGPMFSGKTEELIRRIHILSYAQMKTLIFKPKIDNRWKENAIISRSGNEEEAVLISNSSEILTFLENHNEVFQAIAIDEAQFFDSGITHVVSKLAASGIRIMISGLDQDSNGEPFGPMPNLMAIADFVEKQHAICLKCFNAATMTYRKNHDTTNTIAIGDVELYEPRCRVCHELPN